MTSLPRTETLAAGVAEKDPRRWIALAVIASSQLMVILDASIVNIALPSAQRDLGISDADRQWVVTAYTLAFGGLLLLGGRIADYAGRKRTLHHRPRRVRVSRPRSAAWPATPGCSSPPGPCRARSRALLAPAALSLITVTFTEPKERAKAFSVFGAIAGGGAAIGLVLGGILTEYASWRWCLGVNVPIAMLVVLAAMPVVHESKAHGNTQLRHPGRCPVHPRPGLAGLRVHRRQGEEPDEPADPAVLGWTAPSTIFFLVARRRPARRLRALGDRAPATRCCRCGSSLDRNRGGSYLVFLFVGAGLFAMFLFLTYYLQTDLRYSPLRAWFACLPFSAGIIVGAGLMSQLMPTLGPKPLMVPGLVAGDRSACCWLTQIGADTSPTRRTCCRRSS